MADQGPYETIHIPGARMELKLAKFDRPIAWLRLHQISIADLANWFKTNPNHIHQLVKRGSRSLRKEVVYRYLTAPCESPTVHVDPVDPFLRRKLGIRPQHDSVVLDAAEKRRLAKLESQTEAAAADFWKGVRFEQGIGRFEEILRETRYPAHHRRIRLRARLRQLIAETHLHAGRSSSAIYQGLLSLHLYRIASQEAATEQDRTADLENLGRSARLISQGCLLRLEPDAAAHYLQIHQSASKAGGKDVRPEYYHQLATIVFQTRKEDDSARKFYEQAMSRLARIADYDRPKGQHEIWDIGRRHTNLLEPLDWDGAQELLEFALAQYPSGDIHHAINVNWTAACGYSTDSDKAHTRATEILNEHRMIADGFGHQATTYRLLRLTQNLEMALRPDWVRYVLYENALRDS